MKRAFWIIAFCALLPIAAFCVVTLDGVPVETVPTHSDVSAVESIARAGTNAADQAQATADAIDIRVGALETNAVPRADFDSSTNSILAQIGAVSNLAAEARDVADKGTNDTAALDVRVGILETNTVTSAELGQTNDSIRADFAAADAQAWRTVTNVTGLTYTLTKSTPWAAPSYFPATNGAVTIDRTGLTTNDVATWFFTVRRKAGCSITVDTNAFTAAGIAALDSFGAGTNYHFSVLLPAGSVKAIPKSEAAQ